MKQGTLGSNLVLEEGPERHSGVKVTAREATEQQDTGEQGATDCERISNKCDHSDEQ